MALRSKSVLGGGDFGFASGSSGSKLSKGSGSTLSASNVVVGCLMMIFQYLHLLLLLHGLQVVLLSICDFLYLFQNICLVLDLNAVWGVEAAALLVVSILKVHEVFRTITTEVREDVTDGSAVGTGASLSASCLCICS